MGRNRTKQLAVKAKPSASASTVQGAVARGVSNTAIWQAFQRLGGNLTPLQISRIMQRADAGDPSLLVSAFHEFRQKDGHFQSVCQSLELSLSSLAYSVSAPKGESRTKTARAAEFISSELKRTRLVSLLTAHLIGEGTAFGFSAAELLWKLKDTTRDGSLLTIEGVNPISCNRFKFRREDCELVFTDLPSIDSQGCPLATEFLPPEKLVLYLPRVNGDVRVREGMARMSVWMCLFRNWSLRDWIQLGELGWKPYRKGKYKKGADDKDIAIITEAVLAPNASGSALPDSVELNIEWPKGQSGTSGGTHIEILRWIGDELSKGWLGQTLTSDGGKNGSRSLGEVHERQLQKLLEARAGELAAVFQGIVNHWTRLNWGPNVEPPTFSFNTENGIGIVELANATKAFREARLRVPAQWVRDRAGIPEPSPKDELVGDSVDEKGNVVVSPQQVAADAAAGGTDATGNQGAGDGAANVNQ